MVIENHLAALHGEYVRKMDLPPLLRSTLCRLLLVLHVFWAGQKYAENSVLDTMRYQIIYATPYRHMEQFVDSTAALHSIVDGAWRSLSTVRTTGFLVCIVFAFNLMLLAGPASLPSTDTPGDHTS